MIQPPGVFAMALLDIGNAWAADESGDLFKRFLGSCLKTATNVRNEDPGTPNHANRLIWANGMISGDETSAKGRVKQIIRYAAATNATFQSDPEAIDDNGIEFIVSSLLNSVAVGA